MDWENIDGLLQRRFMEAQRGREYWLRLKEDYQVTDSTYVILIPEDSREAFPYISGALAGFLEKKQAERAVLLLAAPGGTLPCAGGRSIVAGCTPEEAACLMRFYCMYQFAPNFLIASLDRPDGRLGEGMLGCGKCSREELFDMVVFGMPKEALQAGP